MSRYAAVATLVALVAAREIEAMQSVKELGDGVRAQVAAVLPVETHQSYPIPVARNGKLRLRFLLSPSIVKPGAGLLLQPPAHLVEIDGDSGKLVELRAVSPRDFEQADDPAKVIGRYDMLPDARTPEQFLDMQARLYTLYDALLPAFAQGKKPGDEKLAKQARDFLSLFPKVTEQPLQPYYAAAAAEFFAWLRRQEGR
jgi:hypothetical protein